MGFDSFLSKSFWFSLFSVFTLCSPLQSLASDKGPIYFEVRERIVSYGFKSHEDRERTLNRRYVNASKDWRNFLLQKNWNDGYYSPFPGHVGMMVGTNRSLGANESDEEQVRVILQVGNNLSMIDISSLKLADREAYERFMSDRTALGKNRYGLELGRATLADVKARMRSKDVERYTVSEDNLGVTHFAVTSGSIIPSPYNITLDRVIFSVFENRLYSVAVVITKDNREAIRERQIEANGHYRGNVRQFVSKTIKSEYKANSSSHSDDDVYALEGYDLGGNYYWVNDELVVYLAHGYGEQPNDPHIAINHLHLEIHEKVLRLLEEEEQIAKRIQRKEREGKEREAMDALL